MSFLFPLKGETAPPPREVRKGVVTGMRFLACLALLALAAAPGRPPAGAEDSARDSPGALRARRDRQGGVRGTKAPAVRVKRTPDHGADHARRLASRVARRPASMERMR